MTIKTEASYVTAVIVENDADMGFIFKKDEDGDLAVIINGNVEAFVPYEDIADFRDKIVNLLDGMLN